MKEFEKERSFQCSHGVTGSPFACVSQRAADHSKASVISQLIVVVFCEYIIINILRDDAVMAVVVVGNGLPVVVITSEGVADSASFDSAKRKCSVLERWPWPVLRRGRQCLEVKASCFDDARHAAAVVQVVVAPQKNAEARLQLLVWTWHSLSNFFSALYAGDRHYYDGELGFEFEAVANFRVEALGRAVDVSRNDGILVERHDLRVWDVMTRSVAAHSFVDAASLRIAGYAVSARLFTPLGVHRGRRYRVVSREFAHGEDGFFSTVHGTIPPGLARGSGSITGAAGGLACRRYLAQITAGVPVGKQCQCIFIYIRILSSGRISE